MGIIISVLVMCSAPAWNSIRFDVGRRRFRSVCGAFLLPRTTTGGWDDIDGLYVRRQPNAEVYKVWVSLRVPTSSPPLLGIYNSQFEAEEMAEKTARDLGLRVISPPVRVKPGDQRVTRK